MQALSNRAPAIRNVGVRADGAADPIVVRDDAAARVVVEAADRARIECGDVRAAGLVRHRMGLQDLGDAMTFGTVQGAVATWPVSSSSRYRSSYRTTSYDPEEFVHCPIFIGVCYAN